MESSNEIILRDHPTQESIVQVIGEKGKRIKITTWGINQMHYGFGFEVCQIRES